MSTQTLAFFENKTDEQIIDWMLTNLTEEQIKMCLNTSGIPDTSGLTTPVEPEPTPVVPIPVPSPSPSRPEKPLDLNTRILIRLRGSCPSNVILVEKIQGTIVYFYQFKEVTQEDLALNSQYSPVLGQYRWVFRTQARNGMPEICSLASTASEEDIKEDPENYRSPPDKVLEIANEYVQSGLPYPLPFGRSSVEPLIQNTPIEYDSRIQTARDTQIKSSAKINEKDYPEIFRRGIKTFPVIIYKIQDNFLHYFVLSINDGVASLVDKKAPVGAGYNTIFRQHAKQLEQSISDDYPEESLVNVTTRLIEEKPQNIKDAIKQVYTITGTGEFAFFGNGDDGSYDILDEDMLDPYVRAGAEDLDIGNVGKPVEIGPGDSQESVEFVDPPSQESAVDVTMECSECLSDEELKAYKGRVCDLHCAGCIKRRYILLNPTSSFALTHNPVITERKNPDGTITPTVQWEPMEKMKKIEPPSGFGQELLLF